MKNIIMSKNIYYFAIAILLFCSCDNKNGDDQGSKLDNVVTNVATDVTPFSVTLNGVINNYSVGEISRGQYGFLYTTEPSMDATAAEQLFKQYAAEGSVTGCKVRYATNLLDGNSFNVIVSGFQPETTIYYCGIFITKDNKTYIGGVQHTITKVFAPSIQTDASPQDIGVMDCLLSGTVNLDGSTTKDCEIGMFFSPTEEGINVNGSKVVYSGKATDGTFSVKKDMLKSSTTYYYRSYLYHKASEKYYLGDISSFTTKNADDYAVDLGLSVMWASCDLGADDPFEDGIPFAWGSVVPNKQGTLDAYEHYVNGEYVDLGTNISGTEYDAAREYWGGKWRMPTREEVEEFYNNCTSENKYIESEDLAYLVWNGPSKKTITVKSFVPYKCDETYSSRNAIPERWTATLTDDAVYAYAAYFFKSVQKSKRKRELCIRPVCDY